MKTNIQNICTFFRASIIVLLSFISLESLAHFGPRGPFGGTVTCSIVYNKIVYLGTENGGVFESTTSDITAWRARPVGLKSGKITALTHSGNYLFAATADSGIFILNGYVGTDRYWNKINNGLGNVRIKSLVAIDSVTLIAGTEGNGFYKTTDKGANWVAINTSALNNANIISLVNTGTRVFSLSLNEGVYMSDDNGNTWSDFNDPNTSNSPNPSFLSYNATTDELMIKNNNGLFIAGSVSSTTAPIYKNNQANLQPNYNIFSACNNGNFWFLASDFGVFVSSSNTINWTAINTGLPNNILNSIAISDSNLVVNIREKGMYKSRLGTYNWAETNSNFNNVATKTMITSGDSLVIAVTRYGVHISKDLSPNYVISNNGLTDFANISDITIGEGNLYAATKNGGVFMSSDLGDNWIAINTGLSNLNISKLFYGNGNLYLFDNTDSIFVTDINTIKWESKNAKLPTGAVPTSMVFIQDVVYLSTSNFGVFMSYDAAFMSWFDKNTGLTDLKITSLTSQGESLYAGTNGSGVFVKHEGKNWEPTSPTSISHTSLMNLDGSKIQAMGYYKGYVYASYKGGLLTTADSGKTWIAGGNQFNLPSYTNVNKITFVSSRVYVLTENNGLYSNSLSELPVLPDFISVSDSIVETGISTGNEDIYKIWVNSNVEWTVTSDQTWMTVDTSKGKDDGVFNIIMTPGISGVERTGYITVEGGTEKKIIKVIQMNMAVSVEPIININSSLKIYPNPSDGNVSIDFKDANISIQKISIYDITGKLLEERNFEGTLLNLNYASGVYMLNVYTNKGIATQKLIIK